MRNYSEIIAPADIVRYPTNVVSGCAFDSTGALDLGLRSACPPWPWRRRMDWISEESQLS